ncbi:MAG: Uma2 family endonuclease [Bacillota bacterium]|nr:Uma2 family endonuclease [Bacillota bacterium]HHU62374.1 Uma2 family endonuclease [Natronincola sp.]
MRLKVICDEENVSQGGKYKGTPTLVVEIVSPSSRSKDIVTKLDFYMQSGIREYLIVDPDNK